VPREQPRVAPGPGFRSRPSGRRQTALPAAEETVYDIGGTSAAAECQKQTGFCRKEAGPGSYLVSRICGLLSPPAARVEKRYSSRRL